MKLWLFFVLSFIFIHPIYGQPEFPNELRGAWVATVANIDWPSKQGLAKKDLKVEFINLIENLKQNGINAVFFQIRPASDALYKSKLVPWSKYLSGIQGKKPSFDPLTFAIKECHKRNMQIHAWMNPFRAIAGLDESELAENHIAKIHPSWMVQYGERKYLNPGIKEVRSHFVNVVEEVLYNYDLDGIHFDDYFYPYKIAGEQFPDLDQFLQSGFSDLPSWRRNNIDLLIMELHTLIKSIYPHVWFGVSPFGVWRNKEMDPENGSNSRAGQTSYDDLYADVKLWAEKGWVDYLAPQLYWHLGFDSVDPTIMMKWWSGNKGNAKLFIGHGIYRVDNKFISAWQNPQEIPNQIRMTREIEEISGGIHYSAKVFKKNPLGVADSLQNNVYNYNVLFPELHKENQKNKMISKLTILKKQTGLQLKWKKVEQIWAYAIVRMNMNREKEIIAITPFGKAVSKFIVNDFKLGYYRYGVIPISRDYQLGTAVYSEFIKY